MPPQRAAKTAASLALNKAFSNSKPGRSAATSKDPKSALKATGTATTTAETAGKADAASIKANSASASAATAVGLKKKELLLKRDLETDDVKTTTPTKGKGKKAAKDEEATVVSYSYSSGDVTDEPPRPRKRRKAATASGDRLVNPNLSGAAVATIVEGDDGAAKNAIVESTVIPDPKLPGTTITSALLSKAQKHLIKTNPKLKNVVERHPDCHVFSESGLREVVDPFRSLVSGIISQQVSGAAARSIKARFVALFGITTEDTGPAGFPTPAQCLSLPLETLRTAGLSQRKAEYIQGLSEKFESKELTAESLLTDPDDVVVEKLVQVRGIGQWSAEMFLCFGLKRGDVFSTGDLGIQKGCAILAGRNVEKLKSSKQKFKYMAEEDMVKLAEPFKPYRSILMWYLWRLCETDVDAMAK